MKESPERQKLEAVLRSSGMVAGGFLGRDRRPVAEIIEADAAELGRLGRTASDLAARMRDITKQARGGLETPVRVGANLEARMIEAKGSLPCPWPHAGRYPKGMVIATRPDTGASVRWSELSLHLIEAHGFFQGRGSRYRLEPRDAVAVLF